MRQRNIKNLEAKIEENSSFLVREPELLKGKWKENFGNSGDIYLEIGCGKGNFILKRADANLDKNFIAVEGQSNVVLRALEKAENAELSNVRFFIGFVNDLKDYFNEGELKGIYLNFSDPWPKARHDKRRLTYHLRLKNYKEVLSQGGFIEFKTDNEPLFRFTIDEINQMGYEILEFSEDLHDSSFESKDYTTEYEEKFKSQGKKIFYVKF